MIDPAEAVRALRAFNRFHTRLTGVLDSSFMGSGLSLAEARVLFEIAHRQPALAADIRAELRLDPGYLSRIVARFESRGWVERGRGADARQRPISLTESGRAFFGALDARTQEHAAASVGHLAANERAALVAALATVTRLLDRSRG